MVWVVAVGITMLVLTEAIGLLNTIVVVVVVMVLAVVLLVLLASFSLLETGGFLLLLLLSSVPRHHGVCHLVQHEVEELVGILCACVFETADQYRAGHTANIISDERWEGARGGITQTRRERGGGGGVLIWCLPQSFEKSSHIPFETEHRSCS